MNHVEDNNDLIQFYDESDIIEYEPNIIYDQLSQVSSLPANETQDSVDSLKGIYDDASCDISDGVEGMPTILEVSEVDDVHQDFGALRSDQIYYVNEDGSSLQTLPMQQISSELCPTNETGQIIPVPRSTLTASSRVIKANSNIVGGKVVTSNRPRLGQSSLQHPKARKNRRLPRSPLTSVVTHAAPPPVFFEVVREVDSEESNRVLDIVDYEGNMVATTEPVFAGLSTSLDQSNGDGANKAKKRRITLNSCNELYDLQNNIISINRNEDDDHDIGQSAMKSTISSNALHTSFGSANLPVLNSQLKDHYNKNLEEKSEMSWIDQLNNSEHIGNSVRGWVKNENQLMITLILHRNQTSSVWGTRQSPNSSVISTRLMWRSQYIPFDGIPFINAGSRAVVMECKYGPRRKSVRFENNSSKKTNRSAPVYHATCPAKIYIKKVIKFVQYQADLSLPKKKLDVEMENIFRQLKLKIDQGMDVYKYGEERQYVQLPTEGAHQFHSYCSASDIISTTPVGPLSSISKNTDDSTFAHSTSSSTLSTATSSTSCEDLCAVNAQSITSSHSCTLASPVVDCPAPTIVVRRRFISWPEVSKPGVEQFNYNVDGGTTSATTTSTLHDSQDHTPMDPATSVGNHTPSQRPWDGVLADPRQCQTTRESHTTRRRIDPRIQARLEYLVGQGIVDHVKVRRNLRQFVDCELKISPKPRKHDQCYYPTVHDLQNRIHLEICRINASPMDQPNKLVNDNKFIMAPETAEDIESLFRDVTHIDLILSHVSLQGCAKNVIYKLEILYKDQQCLDITKSINHLLLSKVEEIGPDIIPSDCHYQTKDGLVKFELKNKSMVEKKHRTSRCIPRSTPRCHLTTSSSPTTYYPIVSEVINDPITSVIVPEEITQQEISDFGDNNQYIYGEPVDEQFNYLYSEISDGSAIENVVHCDKMDADTFEYVP